MIKKNRNKRDARLNNKLSVELVDDIDDEMVVNVKNFRNNSIR